jgi:hypothetical protein
VRHCKLTISVGFVDMGEQIETAPAETLSKDQPKAKTQQEMLEPLVRVLEKATTPPRQCGGGTIGMAEIYDVYMEEWDKTLEIMKAVHNLGNCYGKPSTDPSSGFGPAGPMLPMMYRS